MTGSDLGRLADTLRLDVVRMVYEAGDGHPGPALSIADIVTTLVFDVMRIQPDNPNWDERDRLVLSKGHACPILYAALARRGYYGDDVQHFNLRGLGSIFQGHPVMDKTPGVDFTSGSLGNGIAIAAGMGVAAKRLGRDNRVFAIVGDGELQEGIIWEGVNFAAAHKLDNLVVFIDRNGFQSGGTVDAIIGSNNVAERFAAFGWRTDEICGHDPEAIRAAVSRAGEQPGKPHAVVCDCVKGKGVSYMENDNNWHKGVPSTEQYEAALATLSGGQV